MWDNVFHLGKFDGALLQPLAQGIGIVTGTGEHLLLNPASDGTTARAYYLNDNTVPPDRQPKGSIKDADAARSLASCALGKIAYGAEIGSRVRRVDSPMG